MTAEQKKTALAKMICRWRELKKQYNELLNEPASYSISGSVSATNRNLEDLQREMDSVMRKIKYIFGKKVNGKIEVMTPDYSI